MFNLHKDCFERQQASAAQYGKVCSLCIILSDVHLLIIYSSAELKILEDEFRAHGTIHYIFDAVFPFLTVS